MFEFVCRFDINIIRIYKKNVFKEIKDNIINKI